MATEQDDTAAHYAAMTDGQLTNGAPMLRAAADLGSADAVAALPALEAELARREGRA